jgi:hypothetical protein
MEMSCGREEIHPCQEHHHKPKLWPFSFGSASPDH